MSDKVKQMIKWALYAFLLLLSFLFQQTPFLFSIAGVKPVLLIAAAVAIAVFEGGFAGGIVGAVAGLLWDLGSSRVFGFNAFLLLILCAFCGLLVVHLMRTNLLSCMILCLGVLALQGGIDYLLNFLLFEYDQSWRVLVGRMLPTMGYTLAVTPIFYFLVSFLYRRFFVEENL